MKLLLATVTAIAVFTADCQDFLNKPKGRKTANDGQSEALAFLDGREIQDLGEQYHQLKMKKEQHSRENRRFRCKARNACVVVGGFCVTNATLCSGRLVADGCKGTYCQCCIPGTLVAKFNNLEEELRSFKENINKTNSNLQSEMQSLKNDMDNGNSDLNSKLDSLAQKQGCPKGFFKLGLSTQCFKYFTDKYRSWTAAKTKCADEGLILAKPVNPTDIRSYLVMKFGNHNGAWIGAQGTGSYVKWDCDGAILESSNNVWYPGHPSGKTSSRYCLHILGSEVYMKNNPHQPYMMWSCSHGEYALCELLME